MTEQRLGPLQSQLVELDLAWEEQSDRIAAVKEKINSNDRKLRVMIEHASQDHS